MQVDSGLTRWPVADVFLIPASNPTRGVDGFVISMNWQFRLHVKSFYTFFLMNCWPWKGPIYITIHFCKNFEVNNLRKFTKLITVDPACLLHCCVFANLIFSLHNSLLLIRATEDLTTDWIK
jgi:hypothetical protein